MLSDTEPPQGYEFHNLKDKYGRRVPVPFVEVEYALGEKIMWSGRRNKASDRHDLRFLMELVGCTPAEAFRIIRHPLEDVIPLFENPSRNHPHLRSTLVDA